MNWQIWRLLGRDLYALNIKLLMAVIPDNRDRELMVSAPGVDDFWNSVRSWQKRAWTVGLHGYQHRYLTAVAGKLSACRFSSYRIDSLTPSPFLDRINPI